MTAPQGVFGTPARAALAIAKFRAAYRDWDENEEEREEHLGMEVELGTELTKSHGVRNKLSKQIKELQAQLAREQPCRVCRTPVIAHDSRWTCEPCANDPTYHFERETTLGLNDDLAKGHEEEDHQKGEEEASSEFVLRLKETIAELHRRLRLRPEL